MSRNKSTALTIQELLDKYNGFEKKVVFDANLPEDFKSLSYEDKVRHYYRHQGSMETRLNIICNAERIYVSEKRYSLTRVGRKIFNRLTTDSFLIIRKDKVVTNSKEAIASLSRQLLLALNERYGDYGWAAKAIDENPSSEHHMRLDSVIYNKQILKGILTGKIHSQESLVKNFMKVNHFPLTICWKDFETIWNGRTFIDLYDLIEFTVSPEQTFRMLAEWVRNGDNYRYNNVMSEFRDILKQAVKTDTKVNINWSEKRLREEHQKLTRLLMEKEIGKKEIVNIHDEPVDEPSVGIHQINTELDVFKEGMLMHHCVYTNYWNRIKSGRYLVFHLSQIAPDEDPDGATLGIELDTRDSLKHPFIKQIFQIHNTQPTEGQLKRADSFLTKYADRLKAMFTKPETRNTVQPAPAYVGVYDDEDLPF